MATDPKSLQQMSSDDTGVREWSTISNVHGKPMNVGDVSLPDASEQFALIKQLQNLQVANKDVGTLDWSTISNVHAKA